MFIRCLFICLFLCEFMLETLRTMFDLSVGRGVTKLFCIKFVGVYHPLLLVLFLAVLSVFKLFWSILVCFDIKIRKSHKNLKNCFEKPKKSCFCVFICVLGYLPTQ